MWPESNDPPQPLRTGLTTGSCATACCVAAAHYLLAGDKPAVVSITLPKGKTVELEIDGYQQEQQEIHQLQTATAARVRTQTIKDAGDDPDITHGATIFVDLMLSPKPGVYFSAGKGVGSVTRPGLLLAVGEPAINPVPRQMMTEHLQKIALRFGYSGGFEVAVGVEAGQALAEKTMNGRLGILGGLSILGTSGIVRPFSCSAWIASIYQGIDVAYANGYTHIAASTGNSSEQAIKTHYDLEDVALIEMGDFVGAVFKQLKKAPIARLSICGGFGKMTKLANGHMDLNSRVSAIDFEQLAAVAKTLGADSALQDAITQANTSIEALAFCRDQQIDLATAICQAAWQEARLKLPASVQLEIWAINRQGEFIAHAGDSFAKGAG